jgi:hypothetical protein
MGNCIAGPYYLQAALRGECVLAALRDPTGQILANVELIPHRTGWRIDELRGRFNADPDPVLAARLRDWVHALAPARTRPTPPPRHSAPRPIPHPRGTNHHRRRVQHLQEVGQSLNELAAQALETTELACALEVLRGVPGLPGATALRRASPGHLRQAVGRGVAGGAPDLATLWHATAIRPLAEALANLDPMLRQRFGYLGLLLTDAPLPAAPRRLARLPAVAQARSVDLVARRVRRAIGRMARADDPILARAVPPHADTAMLCALVLAVSTATRVPAHMLTPLTTRGTLAVPGHPASTLDDDNGPWQRAWPVAVELGADADWTGRHPPIVVPTSWLGPGGWAALWARAARTPVS